MIAANIASYHGLGLFVASIFIADVLFWPSTAIFLVVAEEPEMATAEKGLSGTLGQKTTGKWNKNYFLKFLYEPIQQTFQSEGELWAM